MWYRSIITQDVSVEREHGASIRRQTAGPLSSGAATALWPCVYSWYSPRTSTRPPFGRPPRVARRLRRIFRQLDASRCPTGISPVARSLVTKHVDVVVFVVVAEGEASVSPPLPPHWSGARQFQGYLGNWRFIIYLISHLASSENYGIFSHARILSSPGGR